AEDDDTRVVLLHGAGDSFSAGNDIADFLKNPPRGDDSPQSRFTEALMNFDKPLIAAVHGVAIGSGATMLTHCDFVYAAEHSTFQLPFVKLRRRAGTGNELLAGSPGRIPRRCRID